MKKLKKVIFAIISLFIASSLPIMHANANTQMLKKTPFSKTIIIPTSAPNIYLIVNSNFDSEIDGDPYSFSVTISGTNGPPGGFLIVDGFIQLYFNGVVTDGLKIMIPTGGGESGMITISVADGYYT